MAGALRHADIGTSLTKTEWEAVTSHNVSGGARGDLLYADASLYLERLAVGTSGQLLISDGTDPTWSDALTITNDGTKTTILGKTGDYTRVGDAATTQISLASEDDLMVSGKLEVNGVGFVANQLFIGDSNVTADSVQGMTTGIQIDMAASIDAFFIVKNSSVAHGMTASADTDTFVKFMKARETGGGLRADIYKDTGGGNGGVLQFNVYSQDVADTTKSSAAQCQIEFLAGKITGATVADIVANGNIFGIRVPTLGIRWFLDEDGDTWQAGNITTVGGTPSTTGHIFGARYLEVTEMAAPGAGAANTARIYALEGGGDALTDLCAVFQDGSIDVFAQETTEPDSPIFQFPDDTDLALVMRKPNRRTVQFVATFPDGREFVMREIRYPTNRWN